jgi:hypothetical protein
MLTRAKFKEGEGKLKTFNPEIGRANQRRKMDDEERHVEHEHNFHKILYRMSYMVENCMQIMKRE